jgi:MarR family transcriptional regulator for hemolysin
MSFPRSRELGFALHDVARLLRTYADQRAREMSTTRAQWAVLARLQRREGASQTELACILDLTPITVVRLIDKLDAAGLVERRPDAHDRRIHRLYLTEKAVPALEMIGQLSERIMEQALAGLDEPTLTTLLLGLNRIKSNLKGALTPRSFDK